MRIEEHISELLYEYDCVIVPDFGGFIGNYTPAKVDEVKHLFEPPRKKILFNKGLTQNDGLLANHLSIRERVTYAEALKQIALEVGRYRGELKDVKRIVFENIGVLYIDESGNLVFQPDDKVNYLPEAFGLSAFYRLPVTTEKTEEKETKVVNLPNKERSRFRPYAVAAAIGALVASTFWFTVNETSIGNNYANLNIFSKKEASQFTPNYDNTTTRLNVTIPKDTLAIYIKEPVDVTANVNTTVASAKQDMSGAGYHIVAGCFRVYENALNMISILQKKNVTASIVGKTPEGLYIVGCGKYSSYNDAETQLDNFRKNVQEAAWVYGK